MRQVQKFNMNWELKFYDKVVEEQYQESKRGYQSVFLKAYLVLGILYSFVTWMLNPSGEENFKGLILISNLSNLAICTLLLLLVQFMKTNKKELIIFFISMLSVVGYLESDFKNRKKPSELLDFITGSIIQEIMFILLIGKVNWRLITVFAISSMSYCFWRVSGFEKNLEMRFFPLFVCMFNTLTVSCCSFTLERYDRTRFQEKYTYELSLRRFKDLIKNVLPSAVIIARNNHMKFCNEQALKVFNAVNKDQVLENMRKFLIKRIELKSPEPRTPKPSLDMGSRGQSQRNLSPGRIIEQDQAVFLEEQKFLMQQLESDQKANLLDLLVEMDSQQSISSSFDTYHGVFFSEDTPTDDEAPAAAKYFDIKLSSIIWEGELSTIIIMNENAMIQRLQDLNEQARYKDRLLATVSHDLRTPLNGIIGMVESAIESEQNEEVRKRY